MKTLNKKAITLAMLLSIAIISVAQQGNGNRANNGQGNNAYRGQGNNSNTDVTYQKGDRMAAHLDLTEEQQTQIKDLRIEQKKAMLPLNNQMNEMKAKLQTLSTTNNADIKTINAQIDKMGELRTQMMKNKAAHRQAIRMLLTDDQRILFDSQQGQRGKGKGHGQKGCNNRGQGKGYNRI